LTLHLAGVIESNRDFGPNVLTGIFNPMPIEETKRESSAVFEAELRAALGPAYSLAYRLTRNRDDAEDLVRDASLRAFRAFDSFQSGSNFRAWFLKILYNLFAKQYAQKRRRVETVNIDEAEDIYIYLQAERAGLQPGNTNAAEEVIGKIDAEAIADAIDALPDEFRNACKLYFMDNLSYQDIADVLGSPLGTVRSKLHRGRKLLQKSLWQLAIDMGVVE